MVESSPSMPKGKRSFFIIPTRPDLHEAVKKAAARKRKSLAQYVREAVAAALARDETYFYVKLPDGGYWPPLDEPGFEELGVARLSAAKRGGELVSRRLGE